MNLRNILQKLSEKRPIFHSEADFQFALAWQIKELYPNVMIRLEVPYTNDGTNKSLDLLLIEDNKKYPIELKYKAKKATILYNNEQYNLKEHSAQDHGRYDYLKDVKRIEDLKINGDFAKGYAIILTNEPKYWTKGSKVTVCEEFRIHEGTLIAGSLSWKEHAGKNTIKGREEALNLKGTYKIAWCDFGTPNILKDLYTGKLNTFKYAICEIT